MDLVSGPMSVEIDTGMLWMGEEWLGFVGDRDCWPEGQERHCEHLLDRFEDATRATLGYAAAVSFSYYERLSIARLN